MSAARMVFNEVDNDARVIAIKARMIETARQFFKVAKDAPSDDERAEVLADRMPIGCGSSLFCSGPDLSGETGQAGGY